MKKNFQERDKFGHYISGHKSGMTGKEHKEETKRKIGKANALRMKDYWRDHPEQRIHQSKIRKGKKGFFTGYRHTKESRDKIVESLKRRWPNGRPGHLSFLWKGGVTSLNEKIRKSKEYKIWRGAVFERDNWTCVWCRAKSKKKKRVILQADHIKPFALFPELRFAIDNGRTLCQECHRKTDTYMGRIQTYEKKLSRQR